MSPLLPNRLAAVGSLLSKAAGLRRSAARNSPQLGKVGRAPHGRSVLGLNSSNPVTRLQGDAVIASLTVPGNRCHVSAAHSSPTELFRARLACATLGPANRARACAGQFAGNVVGPLTNQARSLASAANCEGVRPVPGSERGPACSQICSPTAEKRGAAWVSGRTIGPILNSAGTLRRCLEQAGQGLDRLQNGCLASFLVEGGFDSHAPPPRGF